MTKRSASFSRAMNVFELRSVGIETMPSSVATKFA
jgi:hypothetical protein